MLHINLRHFFICINLHFWVVLVGRRNLQETGVYSELLVVVVMQGRSSTYNKR